MDVLDKMKNDVFGHKKRENGSVPENSTDRVSKTAGTDRPVLGILDAFMQNHALLRGYISRFFVSSHEIDDVSQETFLRAFKAEKSERIEQPKAFLFKIAKNLMLSELARKSRKITDYIEDLEQGGSISDGVNLEDNVIAQQKLGIYCEAIASLPPKCRKVVLMKKVYGMSHKEIAGRLGITISAVDKHLVKGGKRCRAVLQERYAEVEPPNVAYRASLGKEVDS